MQYLDEKDQRIKELENANRILQEKVLSLEHNVEVLTQAASEKTPQIYEQYSLFGELIDEISDKAENKVISIKAHKKLVRKKGYRENLIKSLPHEVVECVLDEETVCEICGS